jgi:small subunit ribosomal protein S16
LVKIRLRRMGHRSRPSYRVVAIDSRRARDGEYLEAVGSYDPRTKALNLNGERVDFWLARGAQPSETVGRLIRRWARQHAPASQPPSQPEAETAPVGETTPDDFPQDANQGVSHEGTD